MSDEYQNEELTEQSFVKRPLSPKDMETKLDEIRKNVGQKMTKWADRILISMSPSPQITRIEGERWSDGTKQWIMKDGVKQSVSTLEVARMPWWCPKCSVAMSHKFDRKFYYLRGWCYNCNIEFEGALRLNGQWPEFEKRMIRENEKSYLRDKINEHQEYIRTFKIPQMHFGDGRWEALAELSDFDGLFAELEKDIEVCLQRLENIAAEEQEELNVSTTVK
jgi:hypothetical protein